VPNDDDDDCLKLGHDHFHIIYNSLINKQSLPADSHQAYPK